MKQRLTSVFLALLITFFNFNVCCFAGIENVNSLKEPEVVTLKNEEGVQALLLSRTEINNCKAKKGDAFSAKLVEDVKLAQTVILPSGCFVKGTIDKVCCPQRLPCRDGSVHISLKEIEFPDGQIVDVTDKKLKTAVYSPNRKTFTQRIKRRLPMQIASYAVSLPLMATDLAGVAAGAIAMGAAVTTGVVTGYMDPDKGKTREESAMGRGIDATPIGTAKMVLYTGENADLKHGDGLSIMLDSSAINHIAQERHLNIKVVEQKNKKKKLFIF